jgi:hypothetical protein
MITIDQFIADITASNYFKDNPQIVDKISIHRWVDLALKSFGKAVMTPKHKVVSVKNYRADLGKDYGGLKLAAWCEKQSCVIEGKEKDVQATALYRERVEKTEFVDKTTCEVTCTSTNTISEKVYVAGGTMEFIYKNPVYVKLGRNVFGDRCNKGCISNADSPYSINIKGKEAHTSFKEGDLYLEYYALPYTDEGDIIIPESSLGFLEQYLEVTVKRQIIEEAIMSKDTPSLATLFSYYIQKESDLYNKAEKDLSPIGLQSFWNLIDHNRKFRNQYSINLGK